MTTNKIVLNICRLVHEKESKIDNLEMTLKRVSDNVVDKEKILDDMQSDKTALSRAMAQNKELKNQLAELQNGFVALVRSLYNNILRIIYIIRIRLCIVLMFYIIFDIQ